MPKLSELMNEAAPVKFTHRGREYNLEAYPDRATRKLREESEVKERADKGAGDAHTIITLVKSWDITGDDDAPLPINRETIDGLSEGLKVALVARSEERRVGKAGRA